MYIQLLFVFLFGISIGSFLNVLTPRLHIGEFIFGRSKCLQCNKKLSWYEMVPIFSYIYQSGKCRHCKNRISIYYPITELSTGLLFVFAFISVSSVVELFFALSIIPIIVSIFVYDMQHKIIPDFFTVILSFFAFVYLFFSVDPLMHFIAGFILSLPFFLMWFISKGEWIGFGDVKLAIPLGWFVGIGGIVNVFLFSFIIGAIVSIFIILFQFIFKYKVWKMKTEIPFAPFLLIAFIITIYTNIDLNNILSAILKI